MFELTGHKAYSLPIEEIRFVSNLIEFEGPILSHYVDKFENNYLFYWVDSDENYNRWLIWKVAEKDIYNYLLRILPLDKIFPNSSEMVYVVDVDAGIEYRNVWMSYVFNIPEQYLPETDSYYQFEAPDVYTEKLQVGTYLEALKEKALYFNVEPAYDRYGVTVGVEDVFAVLENLTKSIAEFVKYRVHGILSSRITDLNRIVAATKSLSSGSRLRVCYLNLNSFHVGIAADNLNIDHSVMDPSIEDFQRGVLDIYKNEVLDNDFGSAEDIKILIEKFPDAEQRKKIFDPLVKIINNENIKVNITDYSKSFSRTYRKVSKVEKTNLVPPKINVPKELQLPDQTLMVAYLVADKDDSQQTLFPKDVTNRIVYKKETNTFPFEFDSIKISDNPPVLFNRTIDIEGKFEGGYFTIQYDPLDIIITSRDKNELQDLFNLKLLELYTHYRFGNDITFSKFFEEVLA